MLGFDFHRQRPIDQFIVDFFCPVLHLAIEIDGSVHDMDEAVVKDKARQEHMENLGIKFLRFKENDVRNSMDAVLNIIEQWIRENK